MLSPARTVEGRPTEPLELSDALRRVTQWICRRQSMHVRPHLDGSSPKTLLGAWDVCFCFSYTGGNGRERPDDCLRPSPLHSIDRAGPVVSARMHPYIGGITYDWGDHSREQQSRHGWCEATKPLELHGRLQALGGCLRHMLLRLQAGIHDHP